MSDLGTWYRSLPLFTRYWLTLTVGFTLAARFGIIHPKHLILLYEPVISRFQIWRPVTALFFYPLSPRTGFHFLINCYFLYSYSLRLERGQFEGRPADYFFLLTFNWLICVILALLIDVEVLMDPMVLSVLYIWCQLNKDVMVNFWFGSRFKAMYLPWVLLAFNAVVMGGAVMELLGIVIGHVYFFLMYKYPQELAGPRLISTPDIFYHWFPSQTSGHGFGLAPERRAAEQGTGPRRHDWGRGYSLGHQ